MTFGILTAKRIRSQVADNFGNFNIQNVTNLELADINSDKAFGTLLKYNDKLNKKTDAYIQCALLYMILIGQCRVHNQHEMTDLI
ncbi:ER to Golgi transport-related protein [Gigaspora margarita]|uniref:ER to Golgi transport-related protein n=1 Tax=Gigaspora margarita TaxID=4874 RepID=A0A8H4AN08_GIGMA|nr:ER to Golgi transport-related protein [Gigaspora margarita]